MNEIVINPLWIEIGGPALGIGLLLGAIVVWLVHRSKQKELLNSISVLESQLKAEDSLRLEREAAFEQANAQLTKAFGDLANKSLQTNSETFLRHGFRRVSRQPVST